mmetsp:Transcript_21121/g.40322  ORF Transcript_21121/g.40322 Transcript_21121/m.40322 type:complete len:221 (+) Transcript_21121:382-1044(+)
MERPGPGTYDETNEQNFVEDINKKLVSRSGVFGTTGKRFKDSKPQSSSLFANEDSPGPGSYEEFEGAAMGSAQRIKKHTSVFASNVVRFNKTAPPEVIKDQRKAISKFQVPPPGFYESPDLWNKKNVGAHRSDHFISQEVRFPGNQSTPGERYSIAPGPGHYNVKKLKKPVHAHMCFGSNSSRFSPNTTVAPGPGTYESGDQGNAMVKRSFNVTIDGVEF